MSGPTPLRFALLAALSWPLASALADDPVELEYEVVNVFSTIYEEGSGSPLYWPINGTDGLAWDGEGIWAGSCDSMLMAKFDPETGEVIDELEYPEDNHEMMVDHMAWDGTHLWGNVHSMPGDPEPYMGHLIAIDTATGEVAQRIEVPFRDADSMTPMGTAWDGEFLWTQDPRSSEFYRIDPVTEEGTEEPYWENLRFKSKPIYPCGISHDAYSCMWIGDLSKGYYIQVDIESGEVVSYIDPPENPDPTKYGSFRPESVTKLFTGMTTDGDRVWIVDELEGNPLIYELDVEFPTTGACAHPVDNGEACVPDGQPFCFAGSVCAGKSGVETCVQRCDVEGQECADDLVCEDDSNGVPACVEASIMPEGCGCSATSKDHGLAGLFGGLLLLLGLRRRRSG